MIPNRRYQIYARLGQQTPPWRETRPSPSTPYPERSFVVMRNYYNSGALPHVNYFNRSRANDYPNRPLLTALIKRREKAEDYNRKFGNLPR